MGGYTATNTAGGDEFIKRTFNFNKSNTITNVLVDAITEYKGVDGEHLGFTLYDEIDIEALNVLLESSDEIRTQFPVDDVMVTVEKTTGDEINVSVEDQTQ